MVFEMMLAKKPENSTATAKPIRLGTVNCAMNAGPQVRVQKAPCQQSRGRNEHGGKRPYRETPSGQQDESRACQQYTVLQRCIDKFTCIRPTVMRCMGFEVVELWVQYPARLVHDPTVHTVLKNRDQRRPDREP
jgi:hypothetical protein